MKTYSATELKIVLDNHSKWLRNEGGERANLRNANLSDANLSGADLRDANLYGADLSDADLRNANLRDADLRNANLCGADLCGADLSGANLWGANLWGANLCCANLCCANLMNADLSGAKYDSWQIVPENGEFIAYKKLQNNVIATLVVPADAKRVNGTSNKCRVSEAFVKELSGNNEVAYGIHDKKFEYRVGTIVRPDSFNDDIREVCTNGIHCFLTRKEAEEYHY